jgi:murein DD-endopeptidase MepM/ murein hydrolase activator NlpD
LQNFHHKRISQVLRNIWLLIAGVLLLGPTAALAESYIRVYKKGVVCYYFSIREHPQLRQPGINPPAPPNPKTRGTLPEARAYIQEMDQLHNLRLLAIQAVIRMEAHRTLKAVPKGAPSLLQLRLGKANDSQVANSSTPPANMWIGVRYLGRLMPKFGYREHLAATSDNPGSRPPDRQQGLPPLQETQALVRDVCNNFLKYAVEQHPQLAQMQSGAERGAAPNQLGYCFPVAQPFSFKDTWGDCRSGGRYHHAVDIFAYEGTPVFAITAGVIHQLTMGPEAGITLFLRGRDGQGYGYMHLQGYAEGITVGKTVKKGELIAYVGRTGILRDSAHLHLQVYVDHSFGRDKLVNPYGLLVQLCKGQGVTDLIDQKIARRRIPGIEVRNYGTLRLSGSMPRRYQGSQPIGLFHN